MKPIYIIEFHFEGKRAGNSCVAYTDRAKAEARIATKPHEDCPFGLEEVIVEYAPASDFHRLADKATAMVGTLELELFEVRKELCAVNRALDTIMGFHMEAAKN